MGVLRKLADQARLADAGLAGDESRLPPRVRDCAPRLSKSLPLRPPVSEHRRAVDPQTVGHRCAPGRRCPSRRRRDLSTIDEGRLVENLGLHRLQLRAWLESQLFCQRRSYALINVKRISLAAAAVKREHKLSRQVLSRRSGGQQAVQLCDQLGVTSQL